MMTKLAAAKRSVRHRLPRAGLQPLFERMYGWSLAGMGIGSAVWDLEESGEAHLIERVGAQLRTAGGSVCVDVGANHGGYADLLVRAIGPGLAVHCIEPGADAFEQLEVAARAHPAIELHRLALGAADATLDLHVVPGHSQLSSLHPLDDWPEATVETVPVRTLDGWAAEQGIDRIDLLKIDVEGAELGVLQGAAGLLARGAIDRVQFEFGARNLVGGSSLRDFFEILDGFSMHRVVVNGLVPIPRYRDTVEIPVSATNYFAVRRGIPVP